MKLLSYAANLLPIFTQFVQSTPIDTKKLMVSNVVKSSNSGTSASGNHFAEAKYSAPKSTEMVKRQYHDLYAAREAIVWYTCPISGPGREIFKWGAHWMAEEDRIRVISLKNIEGWSSLHVITNDFLSTFQHQSCSLQNGHCCVYTFEGTVVGAILDDRIDMTLVTPELGWEHRVKVTELCIRLEGNLICPLHACPVRDVWQHECRVTMQVTSPA